MDIEKDIDTIIKEIEKQSQKDKSDVIEKLEEKGNYYKSQLNHKNALACFKKCHDIAKQSQKNDTLMSKIFHNMSEEQYELGEYENAFRNCKKSLEIKKIKLKPNDESLTKTKNLLGLIYYSKGNNVEGINTFDYLITTYKTSLPADHILIGQANNHLGLLYHKQGNFENAIKYYTNALNILTRHFEPNDPSLGAIYNNIASSYSKLGKYKESLDYYTLSLAIEKEKLQPKDPRIGIK